MTDDFSPQSVSAATSRLTGEQRQFLTAGINQGLSANRMLEALRAGGIGLGRTRGLTAIRELRGVVGQGSSLNRVVPALRPSETLFKPTSYIQDAPYRVWAEYTAVSPVSGTEETYRAVIALDELTSREDIDEQVLEQLGNASAEYGFSLEASGINYTTLERRA